MGFMLRAALAVLGAEAQIIVAELVPAVLTWAPASLVEVFGESLTDPRVSIREADIRHLIQSGDRLSMQSCSMSITVPRD